MGSTRIPEVLLFQPKRFGDDRGYFREIWKEEAYRKAGILLPFVQDNYSFSRKHVIRGLHFQNPQPQGKLIVAIRGEIFDVAVDIRVGSPTFGKWTGELLSEENGNQLYIPPGFAHGFSVLSDEATVLYKCTDYYSPTSERSILWNDPDLGIDWKVAHGVVSDKDGAASELKGVPRDWLPKAPH